MNKKVIIAIVVIVVLALLVIIPVSSYNSLVSMETQVEAESANIDTQLQRRLDLIPNLVETVKAFSAHESEVFDAVTEARANLMSAGSMEEKAQANDELTGALNSLIAIAEAYPELKSDSVYVGLMDELAGTENRIAYARTEYNAVVSSYNQEIRKFPGVFFANMFGFEKADFFEASGEALNAVEVNFE